jgi:hypothetical protein
MNMMVNLWAVIVSAAVSMVIGSVWYGPLFGRTFMTAMGMDKWTPEQQAEMKKKMVMSFVLQFVASLVMFYVLSMFMGRLGQMNVGDGLMTAFWIWLGFIVPLKFGDALWGGNMILFWLGISEMLLTLLAGGAIIGAWK